MHPDSANTYRLNWSNERTDSRFATFFNVLTPLLDEGMQEIEAFTRLARREHLLTVNGVDQFATVSLVDASFFSFFAYPALQGDPDSAISDMGSAVLTEAAAQRLFADAEPVGQVFTVDDQHVFRVAAIVANSPANSHLGANIFVNIENIPALWNAPRFWSNADSDLMYHYVRLMPGADAAETERAAMRYLNENLNIPDTGRQFILQPLRAIHFTTDLQNELPVVDDMLGTVKSPRQRSDIGIFSAVALLTLLIAALNFMNMRAVQFSRQAREIGIRSIAGSSRPALVLQLLGETALLALLALMVTLPLGELLLPSFSAALGTALPADSIFSVPRIAGLALLALAVGVVAGLYPALGAARITLNTALRGEFASGRSPARVRSVLIVLQFTISICLIAGSFVVKQQLEYAYNKPLGFDPANVVLVELPNREARSAFATMRSELQGLSGVIAVAAGSTIPTGDLSDGIGLVPDGGDADSPVVTRLVSVREDFFRALGMEMVAGRALSESFATDRMPAFSAERTRVQGSLVLNASAARLAGWNDPALAIGEKFHSAYGEAVAEFTVVGVVADAHYGSIRREVEPVSYVFWEPVPPNVMVVRLNGADNTAVLAGIERVWRGTMPDYPIRYSFLEDTYSALYDGEARTFALFITLSSIAILIACSGLYGLASWINDRRTKEIGVRKVLGGSVWGIVLLLTNDFSRLVLLSNLIAWPVAYVAMDRWLENFAYRIDLTPLVFIGSGLIALCIAWVTVGGTAAKAASAKPVLALRYE
jgi:putative ABC transport system permease protein